MSVKTAILPHALLGALLLGGGAAAQSAESLFEQGVDAFRRGDVTAAAEALRASLAENPGNEDAYRMWESVERRVMTDMLLERGELGRLAERFLGLATLGRHEIASDPGNAEDVVARLLEGDATERQTALLELRATFGQWAVPALVGPLGSSDIDDRVTAIQALRHLGTHSTLPLIEVLEADDPLLRRNAASVLGSLRDARAAAALAWTAQQDEDPVVRDVAADALGKLGPSTTDATALSIDLALGYFNGRGDLVRPYDAQSVVWSWEGGALAGRPVLAGMFALELAEQAALDALAAGAGAQVKGLLAAIHGAQKAEIEAASELEELQGNDVLDAAVARLPTLERNLALAGNQRGVGLLYCLQGDRRNVAGAIALIDSMGASQDELQALTTALADEDTSVSLAAALGLARLGRVDARVAGRLGAALGAVPDRQVVAIGDTGLSGDAPGWFLLEASTVAEGLARAKSFPPKDVVVLREGLQGVTLDTMVFGLRNDPRTVNTPLIIVTDDVAGVTELYGDEVAAVVATATFDDVIEAAGERDAEQQRALEHARAAAEALASFPPALVAEVGGSLADAIGAVEDEDVLVALLGLAGEAEVTSALGAVEARIADGPTAARVAAMEAAARLWAVTGSARSADGVRDALLAALDSDDEALSLAAAAALGSLPGMDDVAIAAAMR